MIGWMHYVVSLNKPKGGDMELLPEYQGLPLEDQLAIMRRKALDGTLSIEEMRVNVQYLRSINQAGISISKTKRAAKAKVTQADADAMLKDLEGL